MELRSPCGGAIGQMAYYYDGNIYTCDEGRMLSEMGNDSFKLGNVMENTYKDLMKCDCTKAMCVSSCIECLPYCSNCVYMPYCGTCPVINLAQDNNIFARKPKEFRCKVYGGILDTLFDYIENVPTIFDNATASYLINLLKIISRFKTSINNDEYYYKIKCDNEYKLLKEKKNYILDDDIVNRVLKRYDQIKNLPINNEKEIVHSDISTSNLLTAKDGYYLIDFDEVRFTSKLYDLAVILVKFFFDGKNIDIKNAKSFVDLYLKNFSEYDYKDCYNVFEYYVVKQLLEKFSDYEIYGIDLYSKQQQQDDFRNWIYYFEHLNLIKQIFGL